MTDERQARGWAERRAPDMAESIIAALAAQVPAQEPDHALHFDPDCEECVYLARPYAVHVPVPAQEERLLRVALERAIDAMDTVREGLMVTDPSAVSVGSGSILRHAAREARRALAPESQDEKRPWATFSASHDETYDDPVSDS